MTITNWEITNEDFDLLMEVVNRVKRELDYPDETPTLIMDLNACHSNGCPLDFKGLLEADKYEFSHDIYGIRKAIDRTTGKLTEDCFMPRYALANQVPVNDIGNTPAAQEQMDALCEQHDNVQIKTINLTPRGCMTPEGIQRTNEAITDFENATASVANAATQFFEDYKLTLLEVSRGITISEAEREGLREDMRELDQLIVARRRKQEEFLRAVAGAPSA